MYLLHNMVKLCGMIMRRDQSSALINAVVKDNCIFRRSGIANVLHMGLGILQYLNNPQYTSHQQAN